jgi:hypothetical protein
MAPAYGIAEDDAGRTCSRCARSRRSLGKGLGSIYREMRQLDREFEGLTPEQQRLVDLAEKGQTTLTRLEYNWDQAHNNLIRAMRGARGSASQLLTAGRARRDAQRDWNDGMSTQDRQATRDAAERLRVANAAWDQHRAQLVRVRNAQRIANTAEARVQKAYPMLQQRLGRARQAVASQPSRASRIARWFLGRR